MPTRPQLLVSMAELAYPEAQESASPLRFEGHARGDALTHDKVRIVCRTALDALVVVDDERRFLRVNDSATRLYRTPADEMLASRLDDFSPREYQRVLEGRWADFRRNGCAQGRYEIQRGDGSRTMVEYRATWDFDAGEHLIAVREIGGCALPHEVWTHPAGSGLTRRELEVLQLVADGNSAPEIANLLFVSPGTVKTHLKNI